MKCVVGLHLVGVRWCDLEVERARFRLPYFSIRIEEIREVFPERRFP